MAPEKENTNSTEQEQLRLQVLNKYKLPELALAGELKGLTRIAALSCNAPVAYISLIDDEKLWFTSAIGISTDSVYRKQSYCWSTLNGSGIKIINDTVHEDEGPVYINYTAKIVRFYAGMPLRAPSGHNIGTIAIMDFLPRVLGEEQKASLAILAEEVMNRLDLKLKYHEHPSSVKSAVARNLPSDCVGEEMATPMDTILEFTDMLNGTVLNAELAEYLDSIKSASNGLLGNNNIFPVTQNRCLRSA